MSDLADSIRNELIAADLTRSAVGELALRLADLVAGDVLCSSCHKPAGTVTSAVQASNTLARVLGDLRVLAASTAVVEDDPLAVHLRAVQ